MSHQKPPHQPIFLPPPHEQQAYWNLFKHPQPPLVIERLPRFWCKVASISVSILALILVLAGGGPLFVVASLLLLVSLIFTILI